MQDVILYLHDITPVSSIASTVPYAVELKLDICEVNPTKKENRLSHKIGSSALFLTDNISLNIYLFITFLTLC